jgi:antibiotic biosynthesis monooxygenase (ABM) superfamily enzyme
MDDADAFFDDRRSQPLDDSPERAALIRESKGLVDKLICTASIHRSRVVADRSATGQSPPNWKTTMLVLLDSIRS